MNRKMIRNRCIPRDSTKKRNNIADFERKKKGQIVRVKEWNDEKMSAAPIQIVKCHDAWANTCPPSAHLYSYIHPRNHTTIKSCYKRNQTGSCWKQEDLLLSLPLVVVFFFFFRGREFFFFNLVSLGGPLRFVECSGRLYIRGGAPFRVPSVAALPSYAVVVVLFLLVVSNRRKQEKNEHIVPILSFRHLKSSKCLIPIRCFEKLLISHHKSDCRSTAVV